MQNDASNTTQGENRLYGLDWLRFFAILAIVSIHSSDEVFRRHNWFPTMNAEAKFYFSFSAALRFGTLTFFMMSGFLMETRLLRAGKRPEARWKRYAIPLLAASSVYTAVTIGEAAAMKKPLDPGMLLLKFLCGQAFYHTWFLLNALVYAVTHRILRFFASPRVFWVVAIGYTLLFAFTRSYWHTAEEFGTPASAFPRLFFGAAYYIFGIWAASRLQMLRRISLWFTTLLIVSGGVGAILYGVLLRERYRFNFGLEALSLGLFLTALHRCSPPPALVRRIVASSLGIYLWHPLALALIHIPERKLFGTALSNSQDAALLLFDILIAIGGGLLVSETLARAPLLRPIAR